MSLRRAPNLPDDQISLKYYVQKADGRLEERQPYPACSSFNRSTLATPLVWDLVERSKFLSSAEFDEMPVKAEISSSLNLFRKALLTDDFAEQERLRSKLRKLHVKLDRIMTLKERVRVHPSGITIQTRSTWEENLLGKCKQAIDLVATAFKRAVA